MNNPKVIVIFLIIGVAWLQYNLGFYAAIAGVLLIAVVVIFSLATHHQRSVSDSLIEHKKADTRLLIEHMRILRQSLAAEHKLESRAAQMAMPLVRHSVGAVKAQLEAKYAAKYERLRLAMPDDDLPADQEAIDDDLYDDAITAEYEINESEW